MLEILSIVTLTRAGSECRDVTTFVFPAQQAASSEPNVCLRPAHGFLIDLAVEHDPNMVLAIDASDNNFVLAIAKTNPLDADQLSVPVVHRALLLVNRTIVHQNQHTIQ